MKRFLYPIVTVCAALFVFSACSSTSSSSSSVEAQHETEKIKNIVFGIDADDYTVERKEVARITSENLAGVGGEKKAPSVNKKGGVAKNAPCPCGSGKKYKHCCGK